MPSGSQPQSRIEGADAALSLYHLLDPKVLADPYPLFRRLREEDPVHWDPFLHAWVVTRYSDVVEVLHSYSADRTPTPEQLASMGLAHLGPIAQLMVQQMLFMDASQHGRLRGLASRAFTPARVEALRAHVREIVNRLLDEFQDRGSIDAIADLGEPLPAIITAEMLGVPVEDRFRLKRWSANFAEMLGNFQHNPERAQAMLRTVEEMTAYFRDAVEAAKRNPREGLIQSLLTAEIAGDRLSEEEIVANVIITMVGGQETTTNLIGNGVLTLLRNADQLERLRADLSLIPSAVEEMLRFESPSQHTARLAPADVELGGKHIQKRQAVIAVMAAGNRDPERFAEPDRFDIARPDNRHLAFGYAAHFCFGAPLARLEGQIVFETLLARFPKFHLEPQELCWRTNLGLRGLNSLKITLERPGGMKKSLAAEHSAQAGSHESAQSGAHSKGSSSHQRLNLESEWNDTARPFPAVCIHQLFEELVRVNPSALAIDDRSHKLSYEQMNRRANRMAHFLRRKGVSAEVPVAICLKRSWELLVSLLAVLKAGGACVPLDPDYPSERLSHILDDCGTQLVITKKDLLPVVGDTRAHIACLESIESELATASDANPATDVTPQNLAYIIYTSGSTGKPRGVQLPHEGLVNHGQAAIELYGLSATERMLQFASISFDIAIEEIWPTWFAGGCVIPRGDDVPLTAAEFLHWIAGRKITALDLPTAYWHELVHELSESQQTLPESLRLLIVGGEKASASAYSAWLKAGGARVKWVNTYGPTEASVIASAWEPDPKRAFPDNLPIGTPVANVRLYVLDEKLSPVPVGTPGELHIGGAGLARGYLNQPQLTEAKFIEDPFSADAGARMYKTGDMVRRLPDGNLEFVGRIDFQVKIRGFRVELGEIEAVLEKHPAVAQAVVTAREVGAEKQLVAYVVSSSEQVSQGDLRQYLKKQLPEYMVPADFVFLETFPLTPNGKVDRKALPEPNSGDSDSEKHLTEPRNEAERKMARLWARVLGRESVGLRENFFDLGGHSLLALRLAARIEREFGKKITLTALIEAPTVEEIVKLVQREDSSWSPLVTLQAGGSAPALYFVHGLGGTVMRFHDLARHMAPDQPLVCFQAQGIDGKLAVLDDVNEMAEFYLKHLRKAQSSGPYYLGGYSFGGVVALEMARRLNETGEEVGALLLVDTYLGAPHGGSSLVSRFLSLTLQQKIAYVRKRVVRYGRGIKRRIDSLSLPAPVKAVRSACAVAEQKYHPSNIAIPVTLFRASEKALRGSENDKNGWKRYASAGLEVHEIDGDHGNILNEPNVRQLAAAIKAKLVQEHAMRSSEQRHLVDSR